MNIYDFTVKDLQANDVELSKFAGQVLLIVNTASAWGLVKQLGELQKLYEQYHNDGLEILGFPSNQFSNQEPLDNSEIATHYLEKYGVTFPLFAKVDVNGDTADPLYKYLRTQKKGLLGDSIKWNYTKFLIDRSGAVIKRFAPTDSPAKIAKHIQKLL